MSAAVAFSRMHLTGILQRWFRNLNEPLGYGHHQARFSCEYGFTGFADGVFE